MPEIYKFKIQSYIGYKVSFNLTFVTQEIG